MRRTFEEAVMNRLVTELRSVDKRQNFIGDCDLFLRELVDVRPQDIGVSDGVDICPTCSDTTYSVTYTLPKGPSVIEDIEFSELLKELSK